jgi:hypothetical protein
MAGGLPLKIEHRIGVLTPADAIWPMIADVASWPQWNPLYPKAAGTLAFDAILDLEVALPGLPPRELKARVVDWTPNEQVIWKVRMLRATLRSRRWITATASSPTASSSRGRCCP